MLISINSSMLVSSAIHPCAIYHMTSDNSSLSLFFVVSSYSLPWKMHFFTISENSDASHLILTQQLTTYLELLPALLVSSDYLKNQYDFYLHHSLHYSQNLYNLYSQYSPNLSAVTPCDAGGSIQ